MTLKNYFKILLLTFLSYLQSQDSIAQKEASNFHFSTGGISYNTGTPLNIPGIPTPNNEISIATLSDSVGNIMFDFCFTNPTFGSFKTGIVYDKNNQVMPGSNLFSGVYSFSGSLVAPFPGNNSKYYLFYEVKNQLSWVLMYAIVDMSLNSGLGKVIAADNPIDTIQKFTPFTLTQQGGSDNFWVISCKANADTFYSRFVNPAGISPNKIVSKAGSIGFTTISNYVSLITSPNGSLLAGLRREDARSTSICQVFDINTQTGQITDKTSSKVNNNIFYTNPANVLDALEFSANNKLLYCINSVYTNFNGRCVDTYENTFRQYNLCYSDSNSLSQYAYTKYFFCKPYQYAQPQLAINRKMYMPLYYYVTEYAQIDFPNRIGESYNLNKVSFSAGMQYFSTRQFYHGYLQKALKNSIVYTGGCYPDSLHFSITQDTTARVEWNFGDPASGVNNIASAVNAAHSFSSPGIYTVTAQIFNAANVLIDSTSETIERKDPNQRLLYPLPTDTIICGNDFTIRPHCINGIFEWWSGFDGSPTNYLGIFDSINRINQTQTIYVRMIQNGCNGCEQFDSIKVTVAQKPTVNFGRFGFICSGDSIKLDATFLGASHVWSTGDTTSFIWAKQAGTYWVNSIVPQTGCTASDTITITEFPGILAALPNDTTLCQGKFLILRPQFVNATSHTWNGTSNSADSLIVTQSGKYWVTATNPNGCIASDTINVIFNPSPVFTLGNDTTICGGTLLNLVPSPFQNNVNYLWNNNNTGNNISVTNPGSYWLQLTSTINGCKWQDTTNVNFKTLPNYSLGPDKSVCEKDTIVLNATVNGATGYLWNTGALLPTLKIFQSNIYWCDVNKDGCIYRDSVIITIKPLPVIFLGNDATLCEGNSLVLDATNSNSTYLWQDNSINATLLVTQQGSYSVIVNKENCFARDTINVFYNLKPSFTLGPDQAFCDGMTIILSAKLNNVNYLWQDGSFENKYIVTGPGLYFLTATNSCGSKTDSVYITKGVCKLYVPNTFTPNGDTKNDFFKAAFGENITAFKMQVFNRYGGLIFESKDKNEGWDGKYKGIAQPSGAYIWIISYRTNSNNNNELLKGSVFLAR